MIPFLIQCNTVHMFAGLHLRPCTTPVNVGTHREFRQPGAPSPFSGPSNLPLLGWDDAIPALAAPEVCSPTDQFSAMKTLPNRCLSAASSQTPGWHPEDIHLSHQVSARLAPSHLLTTSRPGCPSGMLVTPSAAFKPHWGTYDVQGPANPRRPPIPHCAPAVPMVPQAPAQL